MQKEQEMRFLAIFLNLVHRIDLIMHILIELYGLHDLAIESAMLESSFWSWVRYAKKSQSCMPN